MLVLTGNVFEIEQRNTTLSQNQDTNLGFSYGHIISGPKNNDGSFCIEYLSTEYIPLPGDDPVYDIITRFKALRQGSCMIQFFIYVDGMPVNSGALVQSVGVQVRDNLKQRSLLSGNLVLFFFISLMLALLGYIYFRGLDGSSEKSNHRLLYSLE